MLPAIAIFIRPCDHKIQSRVVSEASSRFAAGIGKKNAMPVITKERSPERSGRQSQPLGWKQGLFS